MEAQVIRVSIVGASGYTGGELLRILLFHPQVEVAQATSERNAGLYVHSLHPNLRKKTELRFVPAESLEPCDVLFLALPHGEPQKKIDVFSKLAPRIIDLSADFRLRDPDLYRQWYHHEHEAPAWLERFTYGLPELCREEIRKANYVSGVGCNATASILALLPLVRADLLDLSRPVILDVKAGSSEGGAEPNPGSHHPERSGVVRTYAPTGHRHTAEVIQALRLPDLHLTVTSVDMVRGVLAAGHAFLKPGLAEKDLWRHYRAWATSEPFVRIVKEKSGVHRVPDPKILAGSNFADVGFATEEGNSRVVALCAIDNLMKGAAGTAVQCLNLMCGLPEEAGLEFPGLHPA
ncbi:MAG: N-acetyl-gamma-glutamyl-phosphate reductase [Anaerolineales bacterium]|jgi:N-acetyl-gamma-glutamyl-phosphate/LysW-gamma-L-alpha-aminoadipyl-6-phosphate reductase